MADEQVVVEILGDDTSWQKVSASYLRQIAKMQAETNKMLKGMSDSSKKAAQEQQSGLQQMSAAWKKYGSLIKTIAPAATFVGMAIGMKRFVSDSMKEFSNFDKGMREVFTLIPEYSEKARLAMTTDIIELGKEIGRLTDETVPALYQAISAGIPAENAFQFLKTASEAARGGVATLEKSVDVLTTILNAYGMEATEATNVSDALFAAVQGGKLTFTQFAANAANVIPIAAAVGVSIEDVSAALATMTKQGVPMATATTQLRQVLMHLSTAGKEAADVFQEAAGVGFEEFLAQGNNLADAMLIMEVAADKAGVSVNELFGNIRAGMGSLSLTGTGMELFNIEIERQVNNAGAMAAANEEMANSYQFAKDKANAASEAFKIAVGAALEPTARALQDLKTAAAEAGEAFFLSGIKAAAFWEALRSDPDTISAVVSNLEGLVVAMEKARDEGGFWSDFGLTLGIGDDAIHDEIERNILAMAKMSYSWEEFLETIERTDGVTANVMGGMRQFFIDVDGVAQKTFLGMASDWELFIEAMSGGTDEMNAFLEATKGTKEELILLQRGMVLESLFAEWDEAVVYVTTGLDFFMDYLDQLPPKEQEATETTDELAASLESLAESAEKAIVSTVTGFDSLSEASQEVIEAAKEMGVSSSYIVDYAKSTGELSDAEKNLIDVIETAKNKQADLNKQVLEGTMTSEQAASAWTLMFEAQLEGAYAAIIAEEAEEELKETLEDQLPTLQELQEAWHAAQAAMGDYFTSIMESKDEAGVFTVALEKVGEQTVFTSNMTGEQAVNLGLLQEALEKGKKKLREWELGIKSAGSTAEKAKDNMNALRADIAGWERQIAELKGLGGTYSTVVNEVVFNQDALNQALYESTNAADANSIVLSELGVELGMISQAEAEAALQAVAMKMKIEELGKAIAEGMPIDRALVELEWFKDRVSEDYRLIVESGDTEATLQNVRNETTLLREEAGLLDEEMPIEVEVKVEGADHEAFDDIAKDIEAADKAIHDLADNTEDNMGDFGGDMEGVSEDTETAMEDTAGALETGMASVSEAMAAGTSAFVEEYVDGMEPIVGKTQALTDRVAGTAKSGQGKMEDAGVALITGMMLGLRSKQSDLYALVAQIVEKAIATANETAQNQSPSRRMYEVGSDMGAGMFYGILSWSDAVSRAAADMVEDAVGAAESAASSSASTTGNTMTTEMAQAFWNALSQGYMTPSMLSWFQNHPFFSFQDWYENVWVPGNPNNTGTTNEEGTGDPVGAVGFPKIDSDAWKKYQELRNEWVMEAFGGWRNYDEYRLQMLMAGNPDWVPGQGFPVGGYGQLPMGVPFGGGFGGPSGGVPDLLDDFFRDVSGITTQTQIEQIIETLLQQYGDMTSEAAEQWIQAASESGVLEFPPDFPNDIQEMIENLLSTGILPAELLQILDFTIADLELVLDLIGQLEPQTDQWFSAMERVLGVASDLMGSASFFANLFEEQTIAPLEEQMAALIEEAQNVFDLSDEEILAQLPDLIEYAQQTGNSALLEQLLELQALQEERNALEAEYLAIQQQQQQLAFLQQQLDLIQTLQEAGLDPSEILGGIELGLDASLPDLMAAISAAIQALIDAANDELGIASPSSVFEEMGMRSMQGFALGLLSGADMVAEAISNAVDTAGYVPTPVPDNPAAAVINVNFGDTYLDNGMDAAIFADKVESAVMDALSR